MSLLYAHRYFVIFLILSSIAAIAAVVYAPIDLAIAHYLQNQEFNMTPFHFIHEAVKPAMVVLTLGIIGLLVLDILLKKQLLPVSRRQLIYLLAVLAMGPGLVVNLVFKDHWDRARPHMLEEFGNDKHFTPAFVISDQCEDNCSFVSGDASAGFFFFAFYFAFSRRKTWFITPILLGSSLGFVRMVQNAHFFTDVVFAGVFTYCVAYILAEFFIKKETNS